MKDYNIELDKCDGKYLLHIGVYQPGRAGYWSEIAISKNEWDELKDIGVKDLTEVEE